MLSGKGFMTVYNLSGGIKAWNSKTAIGAEDLGLELFMGNEASDEILVVAYSLEEGLREFYLSMIPQVESDAAKGLFKKLSTIEIKHQERIFGEYIKLTGKTLTRQEFEKSIVVQAVEGGLSTEAYMQLFQLDSDSVQEVIGVAMSIEAQALDLYLRAAENSSDPQNKKILSQIATEEKAHLGELGKLMERTP
jgi:rubrerythrin